jgi:hypothetical protein
MAPRKESVPAKKNKPIRTYGLYKPRKQNGVSAKKKVHMRKQ